MDEILQLKIWAGIVPDQQKAWSSGEGQRPGGPKMEDRVPGLREGHDSETDHEEWINSPEGKERIAQQRADGMFKDVDDRGWKKEPIEEAAEENYKLEVDGDEIVITDMSYAQPPLGGIRMSVDSWEKLLREYRRVTRNREAPMEDPTVTFK